MNMSIEKLMQYDVYAKSLGITIDNIGEDSITMSFVVAKEHLNAANLVHGGALFTLADFSMGTLANMKGVVSLTLQSDIRFLFSAGLGEKITATATEVYVRKSMSHYRSEIRNSSGELIALAEGMFHRKKSITPESIEAQK